MVNEKKLEFDKAIRRIVDPDYKKGKYGHYEAYVSKTEFARFLMGMKKTPYYENYLEGDGGELKKQNGYPPKMACLASSSRFIYLALKGNPWERIKEIAGLSLIPGAFRFEKKLQIKGKDGEDVYKATPNLDAAYIANNHSVYIEAKMHEIFDCHALKWRESYFKAGVFSAGDHCVAIEDKHKGEPDEDGYIEIDKEAFGLQGESRLYLDLKQLVCHLLGIVNDPAKEKELIYLLHRPESLGNDFHEYYDGFERQFETIANKGPVADFCRENRIALKLIYVTNDKIEDGKPLEVRRVYPKGE